MVDFRLLIYLLSGYYFSVYSVGETGNLNIYLSNIYHLAFCIVLLEFLYLSSLSNFFPIYFLIFFFNYICIYAVTLGLYSICFPSLYRVGLYSLPDYHHFPSLCWGAIPTIFEFLLGLLPDFIFSSTFFFFLFSIWLLLW